MKVAVLLFGVLTIACAMDSASVAFRAWAAKHNKVYTAAEEPRRMAIFRKNMKLAAEMNERAQGLTQFGANKFADLTQAEFKALYLGTKPQTFGKRVASPALKSLPESFDWRDADKPKRVGPVQNQGNCGSCWAFSTIGYLEGLDALTSGSLKKLSEQQLVDCSHNCKDPKDLLTCNWGCNGGFMVNGMNYALQNSMMALADYPYTGRDGKCKYDEAKAAANFTGEAYVLSGDEEGARQHLYEHGPLSVAVNASPWSMYMGGVFASTCANEEKDINHGVLAVGWGKTDKGVEYWIIRNSWGPDWGEDGYIRLKFGENVCGVANDPTYIVA